LDYAKVCFCSRPSIRPQLLPRSILFAILFVALALTSGPAHAQSSAIYGSGINADALNNIRIGPWSLEASYRFIADHTGTVSKVHFYVITSSSKSGYNAGTGGKLLVRLETDDGTTSHRPSGTSLGSYTIDDPKAGFPAIVLSPAPKLEAGQMYHLVFANTDPSPSTNYVSVDDLYMYHPLSPMQPMSSHLDCATLIEATGESWSVYDYNTPIFQIDFTDGTTMGMGYTGVWPEVPQKIGGNNAVRETFTVTGATRTVTGFSIRVARVGGGAGLTVRLETSDGTLVDQGTIAASAIPLSSTSSPDYVWATLAFPAVRTLYSGDGYHVVLQASSGTTYQVFPIRKGSAYGFTGSTYFPSGYAQFKSDSSWVGWTQWGVTNRTDADLQFYFSD
jgi:hypothetical protein